MPTRASLLSVLFAVLLINSPLFSVQQPTTPTTAPTAAPPAGCPRGGGRGAPPVRSPEVLDDGRVTFRLRAPNAKEVGVTFRDSHLAMQRDDQGVWSVTSRVLVPDYYTYSLVVDGTSINDPLIR